MWIFAKIADLFIQKHLVVSWHLIEELAPLRLKKPIEVRDNPVLHSEKYPKQEHEEFNILYYRGITSNQVFMDWLYGYDIMQQLKKDMPEITVIEINGKADMSIVFPHIDFYARPNRHDGCPRLTRECDIQDIPYYHSYSNPSLIDLKDAIKKTIIKNS